MNFYATMFAFPVAESFFADGLLPSNVSHGHSRLLWFQNADSLPFTESSLCSS